RLAVRFPIVRLVLPVDCLAAVAGSRRGALGFAAIGGQRFAADGGGRGLPSPDPSPTPGRGRPAGWRPLAGVSTRLGASGGTDLGRLVSRLGADPIGP